jgi:hypothetical protein
MLPTDFRLVAVAAAALISAACSDDSEDPSAVDRFEFEPVYLTGLSQVGGVISVPAGTQTSGAAVLALTDSENVTEFTNVGQADEYGRYDLGAISGSLTYSIRNLRRGEYLVGFLIDADDDGVPSAGDLAGYYGGSVDEPALRPADATVVRVDAEPLSGVDFGVGPVSCLSRYGESCRVDSDCAGTTCVYASAPVRGVYEGACDPETLTCRESPAPCPVANADVGAKVQGDCFGAPAPAQ